jgi:hypothetical protein
MTSKFLTSGSNNLTNGSANLFIAGMTVSGLDPSLPVKTNGVRTLVSAKLDIVDINNLQSELDATISNPLTSDLNANNNNIANLNTNEFNKITTPSNASANTLKLYASSGTSEIHMIDENGVDSVVGGNVFNQDLNTTDDVEFNEINTNKLDALSGATLDIGDINATQINVGNGANLTVFNNIIRATRPTEFRERVLIGTTQAQEYLLPLIKGNNGDVMVDAVGGATWVAQNTLSPYDQDLNVANNVEFNNITSKNLDLIHTAPRVNFFDQTETKKYTIELSSGQLLINNGAAQNQIRIRDNNAVEFPLLVEAKGGIITDVINEVVLNAGVIVEGVLLKDTAIQCGGIGVGEFPTANISIKAPVGQDALIKLDTTDAQNSGIQFNNEGVKQWVVENRDDNVFSITKADSSDVVKIGQNGAISLISPSITLGTSGQDFIINEGRGTVGQVLTTDGVGGSSWVGSSYGFQYLNDNTTATTITAQNNVSFIAGTKFSGLLQDFTADTNGLTYTGANTKVFKVDVSLTWALDGGSADTCVIILVINNTIIQGTKQTGSLDDSSNFPRNCTTNALISLTTNDIIKIGVANTTDTTDILVSNLSFIVSSV